MDVMSAIKTRKSIRQYLPKPVEEDKLNLVLEAARLSPSARNDQNWHFIVVRDEQKKDLLFEASYEQPWVKQAPCAIVACATANRFMDCGQPTETVNLSIAMSYMILEAHELGLGTCWLGHFNSDKVKEALDIPKDVTVIGFTPLGYPAESPELRPRKELSEIVSYDTY
ncbi:MAG: nitroreductase family protein [Oscillospiraceae bacterium]|nr:nitroreductase family protein [Oscillospiraceae bacterium]